MGKHSEDGAVAIIVAVFIAFVAIGVLALATDIGSLWQSQRALVTDTDAAALAGAIELAETWMDTGGDCGDRGAAQGEAVTVLGINNPDGDNFGVSAVADCEPSPATAADFSGWVQTTARQSSPGFVSGRDDLSAGGTSTAEFLLGVSAFEEGLAICADLFGGTDVLDPNFTLVNGNLAIPYTKATQTLVGQLGTACGVEDEWNADSSPANTTKGGWGWLDGTCELNLLGEEWCDVTTGTAELKKTFEDVVGEELRFPIFDAWNAKGGTNADLRIVGYMRATLESTCEIKGGGNDPAQPQDCNLAKNLSNKFSGQPEFIIVSGARPFFNDDPVSEMFDEATYSICDVDGDRRFCRSTG